MLFKAGGWWERGGTYTKYTCRYSVTEGGGPRRVVEGGGGEFQKKHINFNEKTSDTKASSAALPRTKFGIEALLRFQGTAGSIEFPFVQIEREECGVF